MFCVYFPQSFTCDVGIYLGCRDIRMPEHSLNRTQVGTILQKMGCKGMAHGMRRNTLGDACLESAALNNLPEALTCQALTRAIEKEKMRAFLLLQPRTPIL